MPAASDREKAEPEVDVIVIGTGIAGLSAAITAAEAGLQVLVIDAADVRNAGGNTKFSIGVARVAFAEWQDLGEMVGPDTRLGRVPFLPYPPEQFAADLARVTQNQGDDALHRIIAEQSAPLVTWLRVHGVRWTLSPFRFGRIPGNSAEATLPPGAPLFAEGGGAGLIESLLSAARAVGVRLQFGTAVRGLALDPPRVVLDPDGATIEAAAVVLAAGGFTASRAARASYLGNGWDLRRFRGSPFNTGRVLDAALAVGGVAAGHWSGVHSVASDPAGPPHGDLSVGDVHGRYSYPYGITVNVDGQRFFDEGRDEKNFTYATIGRFIHDQPGGIAYQLFDATAIDLLEPRYSTAHPLVADTLDELAKRLPVPASQLRATVEAFNEACPAGEFDPLQLDGLAAAPVGQPPKSNWAVPLSVPPFRAYAVEPVISFTFGGLAIDQAGRVLGAGGKPLPGLYACGDIVGGIAVHNFPAGSGMIAAGVIGRVAGASAARSLGSSRD
jgi:tricarballylate dehydrogenase